MPQIITADLTASAAYTVTTGNPDDIIFVSAGATVSNTSPSSPAYSAIGVFHENTRIGIAGTVLAGSSPAIYAVSAGTQITVTATGSILSLATAAWDAVVLYSAGARIVNDGQISGLYGAVLATQADVQVVNTGLITGGLTGIAGVARLENTGTIRGTTAVAMTGAEDTLINRGTILGAIDMGGGEDLFDGVGGTVAGQVRGGLGADLYRVSDAAVEIFETGDDVDEVQSTVDFSLENRGAVENLVLLGSAVRGTGNAGANLAAGNAMANRLDGLDGNDTLNGFAGDDTLRGGAGRDTVGGGEGDDLVIGGRGGDNLTGGADRDSFVFRGIADTGTAAGSRDVVEDFTAGDDIIDLSAIDARADSGGNQAFAFVGTAAFTAIGQLRLNTTGAQPILEGDVTGDGVADFQITLRGIATLTAADLVL